MKRLLALASATLFSLTPAAFAADAASADYPLNTCVVSGEDLGSMGDAYDYIHKTEGQPDRLVRMCCEGCVKKFKKDPAKYLARIDAAKAEAAAKSGASR